MNGDLLDSTDVHIHFPAGAISKDGPSAGVAIATVLVSLFANRCVRSDVAMTGEVTLRGVVLPVINSNSPPRKLQFLSVSLVFQILLPIVLMLLFLEHFCQRRLFGIASVRFLQTSNK